MIIPVFDLNSVILTSIALTTSLVLVLVVFGAYQQRALVTRWMYGLLLIASGLGMYLISDMVTKHRPDYIAVVAAVCLVSVGMSVYVNGIRMLRGYRVYRYLSLVVVTTILASDVFLLNMHVSLRWALAINILVQLWLFAYGCRSLAGKGRDFIGHVFWICCSLFAIVVLLLSGLAVKLMLVTGQQILHFTDWVILSYILLLIVMVLTIVTSLLLLIMNVRTQAGLQAIATLDGLTGVLNRRGLQDAASRMQAVSQRIKIPMAMLIVDLDYFKKVNDVYGHLVGDVVLKACADTIKSALRGGDVIGRYGGEEFCILLPNTGEHESTILAERIRRTIETSPVNIAGVESLSDDTRAIKCTVSVGSVSSETVGYVLDIMFAAADQNLYRAKQSGRNRIASNIDQVLGKPATRSAKRDSAALTID